jgi:hypothetical protein
MGGRELFGLKLFGRKDREAEEMSVAVVRAMLEATRARRTPLETLNEMMRQGNQELRPDSWMHQRSAISGASDEQAETEVTQKMETQRLVELLKGEEAATREAA